MEFKHVKYEPECCKEDVLSGFVVLKKPSIQDLFEGSEIAKAASVNETQATKDLLDWSKKFYVEIQIKNTDGSQYESFSDLMSDAETLPLLNEVAVALIQGINRKKSQALKEVKTKKH